MSTGEGREGRVGGEREWKRERRRGGEGREGASETERKLERKENESEK